MRDLSNQPFVTCPTSVNELRSVARDASDHQSLRGAFGVCQIPLPGERCSIDTVAQKMHLEAESRTAEDRSA